MSFAENEFVFGTLCCGSVVAVGTNGGALGFKVVVGGFWTATGAVAFGYLFWF